ncbi:hypothetical protein NP493_250g03014 [Ridgeia piscesae]|uniref:Uncharacterized protein n=1 Tax=Ridgeia piscesae TaxID=27915 RepID=A0AAD9NYJ2_RIDPI|nr:hypothetical protein NP493_250g03014 [Ridgeia piscesae]
MGEPQNIHMTPTFPLLVLGHVLCESQWVVLETQVPASDGVAVGPSPA